MIKLCQAGQRLLLQGMMGRIPGDQQEKEGNESCMSRSLVGIRLNCFTHTPNGLRNNELRKGIVISVEEHGASVWGRHSVVSSTGSPCTLLQ